jgi:hypothetical protein
MGFEPFEPTPNGRRVEDIGQSCLPVEHHAQVFIILNINCTYLYMIFCKIKKSCRTEPALRAKTTAQAPHDARAGLAETLLNGSCHGPVCQTRTIWPSIPPHDNDGPRQLPPPRSPFYFFSLSLHAFTSVPPHSRQRA